MLQLRRHLRDKECQGSASCERLENYDTSGTGANDGDRSYIHAARKDVNTGINVKAHLRISWTEHMYPYIYVTKEEPPGGDVSLFVIVEIDFTI